MTGELDAAVGLKVGSDSSPDGSYLTIGNDGSGWKITTDDSDTNEAISFGGRRLTDFTVVEPSSPNDPTPKSYVDALKPKATLVTLPASGWDSTAKTQMATV